MSTILDIAEKISREEDISLEEAAIRIYEKTTSGEIRLYDPYPPSTFYHYLFSLYSIWFWLVFTGIILMSFSIYVLPQELPYIWLRSGLGFIISLYLPGYTFIEMLFPKRYELGELERFALGVGLSLALTPLVGFLLKYTPLGIRLNSIFPSISILIILFGIIGVYRKYQINILRSKLKNLEGANK